MKPMNEICHACLSHASRCDRCVKELLLDFVASARAGAAISGLGLAEYITEMEALMLAAEGTKHVA